jgi:hypothetical protein
MACFWSLVGEATARPKVAYQPGRAVPAPVVETRAPAPSSMQAAKASSVLGAQAETMSGGAGAIPACAGRRRFGLLREPLLGRRWTPMVQCGSRAEENLSVDARESPLQPLPTRDQSSFYRPQGRLMRAYQTYIHVPVAAVNACVVTRPPRGVRTSALAICSLILTSRRVERCLYR